MTVLAHGAVGPADELVLLVPVLALLVLAVAALRRRNLRQPPPAADDAERSAG